MDYLTVFCLGGLIGSILGIGPTWRLTIYDGGWFPAGLRFIRER